MKYMNQQRQKGSLSVLGIVLITLVIIVTAGIIVWQKWPQQKAFSPSPAINTGNTEANITPPSVSSSSPTLSKAHITVLSPNGGEKWSKGETHTIMWKNSPNITKVDIYLEAMDQGPEGMHLAPIKAIAKDTIADGNYTWTSVQPDGHCFYILIKSSPDGGPQASDTSDSCFSILSQD